MRNWGFNLKKITMSDEIQNLEAEAPIYEEQLRIAKELVDTNGSSRSYSVAELLSWFEHKRRGAHIKSKINNELNSAGLRTSPHWTHLSKHSYFKFKKADRKIEDEIEDATLRVGNLPTADFESIKKKMRFVNEDETVSKALSEMISLGISQLPVLQGGRKIQGVISLQSICERLNNGGKVELSDSVKDVMTTAYTLIRITDHILDVIPVVLDRGYAFVEKFPNSGNILGIITKTDIVELFETETALFVKLGEAENHLRALLNNKIKVTDIEKLYELGGRTFDKGDPDSLLKLTFGDYEQIINRDELWDKLKLGINQDTLKDLLADTREVRNAIMHFDRDRIDESQVDAVDKLNRLLSSARRFEETSTVQDLNAVEEA